MSIPNTIDPWLAPYGEFAPLLRNATPIRVYKLLATGSVLLMPNLRLVSYDEELGGEPPIATLRYALSDTYDADLFPNRAEYTVNNRFYGPYILKANDRIKIVAIRPDGYEELFFDGEVKVAGMAQNPDHETSLITAVHIIRRAWARPIEGGLYKTDSANAAYETYEDANSTPTLLRGPTFFNPKGLPNMADIQQWNSYPTQPQRILGPLFKQVYEQTYKTSEAEGYFDYHGATVDPGTTFPATHWTITAAVQYLCVAENMLETYVLNPSPSTIIDATTVTLITPPPPETPNLPPTIEQIETVCPYTPIQGKYWIPLIRELCANQRALVCCRTTGYLYDSRAYLDIWKPDSRAPKWLYLQPRGTDLDPVLTNTQEHHTGIDVTNAVTSVRILGAPKLYQASFILRPAFPYYASEAANAASISTFAKSHPSYSTKPYKFRTFIANENGDGVFTAPSGAVNQTPCNLEDLFGEADPDTGILPYLARRRAPLRRLLDRKQNDPGRPILEIRKTGSDLPVGLAAAWTAEPTVWQPVQGGWELLEDRIGIHLTCEDPNEWQIGKSTQSGAPYPNGVVRVVEALCKNAGVHPNFTLRLTVAIEADQITTGTTRSLTYTPGGSEVTRTVDANDRYETHILHQSSVNYPGGAEPLTTIRDDESDASHEAESYLQSLLTGTFRSNVLIPRFTRYYKLGDRIQGIWGRGVSFQLNTLDRIVDGDTVGPPIIEPNANLDPYPYVVRITHTFEPAQETILTLAAFNETFRT
jgi:hypothetical protein